MGAELSIPCAPTTRGQEDKDRLCYYCHYHMDLPEPYLCPVVKVEESHLPEPSTIVRNEAVNCQDGTYQVMDRLEPMDLPEPYLRRFVRVEESDLPEASKIVRRAESQTSSCSTFAPEDDDMSAMSTSVSISTTSDNDDMFAFSTSLRPSTFPSTSFCDGEAPCSELARADPEELSRVWRAFVTFCIILDCLEARMGGIAGTL